MSKETAEIRKKQELENVHKVERTRSGRVYLPWTDIVEDKSDIWMYVDMPGVNERSLDIELEDNVLTIQGFVNADIPEKLDPVREEYGIGDFLRTFTLSDTVDKNKIEASIRNGVLKLRLPKAEAVKPRKIEVKSVS